MRAVRSGSGRIIFSVRRRFGGAVARNRARRRLRAICRELIPGGRPGWLVLVSLGDRAGKAAYQELWNDLASAFATLSLIET